MQILGKWYSAESDLEKTLYGAYKKKLESKKQEEQNN